MKLITQKAAANMLGISIVSLWRLRCRENLSTFAIGGRTQYDEDELLDYIKSKRMGVSDSASHLNTLDPTSTSESDELIN